MGNAMAWSLGFQCDEIAKRKSHHGLDLDASSLSVSLISISLAGHQVLSRAGTRSSAGLLPRVPRLCRVARREFSPGSPARSRATGPRISGGPVVGRAKSRRTLLVGGGGSTTRLKGGAFRWLCYVRHACANRVAGGVDEDER